MLNQAFTFSAYPRDRLGKFLPVGGMRSESFRPCPMALSGRYPLTLFSGSTGLPGLDHIVHKTLPNSRHQICVTNFKRNIQTKVKASDKEAVAEELFLDSAHFNISNSTSRWTPYQLADIRFRSLRFLRDLNQYFQGAPRRSCPSRCRI